MDWNNIDRNADATDYYLLSRVAHALYSTGEHSDFSANNRKHLAEYLNKIEDCKCIVEIGVESQSDTQLSSTSTILKNKNDSTVYIGVDVQDKTHLNNEERNIYTIQTPSQNIQTVMDFVKSKNIEKIDFLFIDGWHSINQCILEFEGYSPYLSEDGIIGFHDINHHPGPRWMMENIDRNVWDIAEYPGDVDSDFGISFVWRKKIAQ